jgi:hypothetical protein
LLLWRLFISSELLMGTKTMSAFEREPGVWSVEKIDDDGGIEQAIFIGPGAERRCRKYAALDAAAAVDGDAGWMPIETARKDGKKVDLWIIPPLGQLSSGACRITDCWFYNGEWRTEDAGAPEGWASVIWEPTHWMPLPAPPSAH